MAAPPYVTNILQDEKEFSAFLDVIRRHKATSYLEIGCKFGGGLWRVAAELPKGSRMVAVDLPGGTRAWPESKQSLQTCVDRLKEFGYDVRLIWGDSTAPQTIQQVRELGPYDVVFIDANHTANYVRQDFANYGEMAKIIAFHDIAWKRGKDWKGMPIDVPQFWDTIKVHYEHLEIKLCPTKTNNGIGVLWR